MKTIVPGAAMLGGIALMLSASNVAATDAADVERPNAPEMSLAEIRAFNAKLPKDHRYFIVCKREGVTGSLAKVVRVCQTREDMDRLARDAQNGTRDIMERTRVAPGCPPPLCPADE
ncbi:MAG: hypothetical protein JHD35_25885 [Sphingopyxis sp.]|nr:hypothetical protein [Sphingopyxis sp.]